MKIARIGSTIIVVVLLLLNPNVLFAHCDTMDGPVIKESLTALDKGDVTPLLKWVHKENEAEVKDSFAKAVALRKKGPEEKEVADQYFLNTIVRIHRIGEGASFTGIKPAGSMEPIEAMTDNSIESGSTDDLISKIDAHLNKEIKGRFDKVMAKKKHMNESVEAGREYVDAYVDYIHYIVRVHSAMVGAVSSCDMAGKAEHKE